MNTYKYEGTNTDPHIALLQVRSTSLEQGLPCPLILIFKYPVGGIIPKTKRKPINVNNNDDHYETLMGIQTEADENN